MTPRYFTILVILLVASAAHAADVPISMPAFGPATNGTDAGMSIVRLGDGFLAIWGEGPPCGDPELHGIRLDRDAQPRDQASFLVAPALYETSLIATAADGDDAYVAWRSYGVSAHLMRVSADGTVTKLSDSVPIARAVNMRASNGNVLFLGSRSNLGDPLTVTLVDRAGVVVRSGVTIVGDNASVMDFIAASGAFLFGWVGADGIHVTRVSADAVAANSIPSTPAILSTSSGTFFRLASNGIHSMASWFDAGTHEIRVLPLSTSGEPMGAPISLGTFSPVEAPAIIGVGDGYEILLREVTIGAGQIAALRVSFDGALQSVHHNPAITFQPAAAQNGDRTVAIWSDRRFATSKGGEIIAEPIAIDGSIGAGTIVSLEPVEQHVRKFLPFAGGVAALWTDSAPNDRLSVGRVTPAGAPIDGAGLRLRESIYDQRHSAIATDGERLFVAWTEGDPSYVPHVLYGAVVSFSGSPSVSVTQLASDAGGESDVAVAWNGQTFTVVYQRVRAHSTDLAALRVDRSGNVVDPDPIPLTPARVGDESPRLSWNGSDYLLVWQRWYDPFTYIGETCYPPQPPLPAELFAQRFSASFTPASAEINLATTTNKDDYLLDVQDDDVSFAGGIWLVIWLDKAKGLTRYARIDTSSSRLDPLNGQQLPGFYDNPILVPASEGWTVAGHEGYGPHGAGRGLALTRIDANGVATSVPTIVFSGTSAVEAVALTPIPLVAYKRPSSAAAYIASLAQRSRAARH
ncbi:MAG TPA: hypothetical protein VN380_00650 [Thermoanaerobaculia bacterium]|nr:hypothetical protein [Thermoanaerobaculia bacterium]